jgi:hypothetical protein
MAARVTKKRMLMDGFEVKVDEKSEWMENHSGRSMRFYKAQRACRLKPAIDEDGRHSVKCQAEVYGLIETATSTGP